MKGTKKVERDFVPGGTENGRSVMAGGSDGSLRMGEKGLCHAQSPAALTRKVFCLLLPVTRRTAQLLDCGNL